MKYGINALLNMGFYDDPIRFMNTLDLDEAEGVIANIETLKGYFDYTFLDYTEASIDKLYDLSLICAEGNEEVYSILLKNVKKLLIKYAVDIASSIVDAYAFVYSDEPIKNHEDSIILTVDNLVNVLDTEDGELFKEMVKINIKNNIMEEDMEDIDEIEEE